MMKQKQKKAEMGIGTLIIFIALLLVAAIAAGVLIQTAGSLQEKALTTGDQAKGQIATNVRVVEVSATDGSNGTIRYFEQIIKLAAGSDPIKLQQALFTMNTYDKTATLTYAGVNGTYLNEAGGYYTYTSEAITGTSGTYSTMKNDFDEDGSAESLVGGTENESINLSLSGGTTITLGACTGAVWGDTMSNNNYISSISDVTCNADGNISTITLNPKHEGDGVFSVEYLQRGSNWVSGNLQRGDILKIYYEAPRAVSEDESIRLNFIPKIGSPTLTEFVTPDVITSERVYLYP